MKQIYTIGEVAKMFGLGIDAIRFYEKKGLVHPQSNPVNQYREYTLRNILELLDIIYYRHLDISVSKIQDIICSGTSDSMHELLKDKRIAVENKIRYEKQLVKKLTHIEALIENVDEQNNVCSLRDFPESYILFRTNETNNTLLWELPKLTTEQYVLCSITRKMRLMKHRLDEQESYILLEKKILQNLKVLPKEHHYESVQKCSCIYMAKRIDHFVLDNADIQPLLQYAKEHHLSCHSDIFVREVPLTSYYDMENYFVELFLPIIEK